jgi:O-antigen biosynthesis protein
MPKNQHILIIGTVWPEPGSSAAGSRMVQLIQLFREEGWRVTFATTASESDYSADLDAFGVDTSVIELNSISFDEFVSDLNPSVVMFDRYMTEEKFGWRVAEQCPNALRILDTEDLHCLRAARQKAWKEGREFQTDNLLNEEIAKREIASIYRCDLSLIISDFEIELLTGLFKIDPALLYYLPFLLDPIDEPDTKKWLRYENRRDFISIGNFLHEPNWNSVLWLKEEIWPRIRKNLPETNLNIYGAYPSQKVLQLHNPDEGFLVHGRAVSAAEIIGSAKVLIAPLRFGAGLKGKLVDAMKYGTPSITTEIGAEGIADIEEWPGVVANSSEEIAEAAVKLYKDMSLWTEAQKHGKLIINSRFKKEKFEKGFISVLHFLIKDLKKHREKNFIGSMLMHHSAASTRYMSKWIEAKNR